MVLSGMFRKPPDSADDFLKSLTVSHDKGVSPAEIQDLCSSVGWSRREPHLITMALENSLAVVSVWDDQVLVGFARATGDKVFNATIWDVAVRPDYQKKGVGKLVMFELIKELDSYKIPLLTLYADAGMDNFYRYFGFSLDASGVRGMFREIDWSK